MQKELIDQAIQIAKENKETFSLSLLKRKLHIGIVTTNLLIDELKRLDILEVSNNKIRVKEETSWL